jgi:hypothetical protein
MARKKVDFSVLQKLHQGEWQIVDFVISVEFMEFFNWIKEYASIGYKQELVGIDGKTKLHIQGAKYDERGIIALSGYLISSEQTLQVPDIISFIFTVKVGESKYSISAACHPITFNYFIPLLEAIAHKWPEANQSIEEYIVRLDRLANGLQDNTDSSQDSKGLGGSNPKAVSADKTQSKTSDSIKNKLQKGKTRRFAPNRERDFQKWKGFWIKVKPYKDQSIAEISTLIKRDPKFINVNKYSKDTISKIIKAGNGGEFGDETS